MTADELISGSAATMGFDSIVSGGCGYSVPTNSTTTPAPSTSCCSASHYENGGDREIDVTGLSGLLADPQTAIAHQTSHQAGGTDALKLDDLATPDDNTDLDANTSRHGLMRKLPGDITKVFRGDGSFGSAVADAEVLVEGTQSAGGHSFDYLHRSKPLFFRAVTTDDTPTDMTSSANIWGSFPNTSAGSLKPVGTASFNGTIVATNTGDDSTQSAVWEISGVLQVTNPAGTPIAAIVGNPTKDVRHTDNAVLDCDIAADGTHGLKITVYGDPTAGKYCVWTATIQLVVAAGDSSNP